MDLTQLASRVRGLLFLAVMLAVAVQPGTADILSASTQATEV